VKLGTCIEQYLRTCGGGNKCVFLVFSFSSFQSFGGSGGGGGSKSCGYFMINIFFYFSLNFPQECKPVGLAAVIMLIWFRSFVITSLHCQAHSPTQAYPSWEEF